MTQRKNPVKAIREFCLSCCGDSYKATKECGATDCALYAFRLGKNPYRTQMSEEQKERIRQYAIEHREENILRLKKYMEEKNGNNQD